MQRPVWDVEKPLSKVLNCTEISATVLLKKGVLTRPTHACCDTNSIDLVANNWRFARLEDRRKRQCEICSKFARL